MKYRGTDETNKSKWHNILNYEHKSLNGDLKKWSVKWHSHTEFIHKQEAGSSATSPYNAQANQAHLNVKEEVTSAKWGLNSKADLVRNGRK